MREEVRDSFLSIIQAIELIENRFVGISEPNDFMNTDKGLMILDSISMRLQIIGENSKDIYKIDKSFLEKYPEIEWENIMRLRDVISHHYNILDFIQKKIGKVT